MTFKPREHAAHAVRPGPFDGADNSLSAARRTSRRGRDRAGSSRQAVGTDLVDRVRGVLRGLERH